MPPRKPTGALRFLLLVLAFVLVPATLRAQHCRVERIIDGDTFVCSGERVRLIGIDAPESRPNARLERQRALGDAQVVLALGRRAKEFFSELLPLGTVVRLELDVQKRDRYGRLLAYVWLPDGRMANEVLLAEGYAMLLTIPPNVRYAERLRRAWRLAIEEQRGLWGL